MFDNKVKKILREGGTALGAAIPDASEFMARVTVDTGIDFLWIDLEHRSFSYHEIRWIPIMARRAGCEPLIRPVNNDIGLIKKALDTGASCLMIPQVNTAEEARQAVSYAKYPPEGVRGVTPTWMLLTGDNVAEYLPRANDETFVTVQIETAEGIENMDEIAEVDGVDVLFAGPADLAASMGSLGKMDDPKLLKFLEEFPARVESHGKAAGTTVVGLEAAKKVIAQGYRFVAVGNLLTFGREAMTSALGQLR